MLMTTNVWTSLARLGTTTRRGRGRGGGTDRHARGQAATWVVERAEGLVPGGWESWCVEEPSGPVAIWLRRASTAKPGSAGRPKVADP